MHHALKYAQVIECSGITARLDGSNVSIMYICTIEHLESIKDWELLVHTLCEAWTKTT